MAKSAKTATIERATDVDEAEDGTFHVVVNEDETKKRGRLNDADEALLEFWETSVNAGSEAYIVIMKLMSNQRSTQSLCDKVPVDKYDYYSLQVFIRDMWGAGDYRLMLMGPDPRKGGARGLLQNQLISIAAATSPSKELALVQGGAGNEGGAIGVLLREVLQELRTVHAQPQKSMAEQMQEMAALVTTMQTAFGFNKKPEKSMLEQFMEQRLLKQMEKMLDAEDDDDEKKESGGIADRVLGMLETMGPGLVQMMASRPPQHARPVRPARPNPNPPPRPASPAPQPAGEKPVNPQALTPEQKAVVKDYLGKAIFAAKAKMDPEPIARMAVEQNPEAVEQLLSIPNLWEEAQKIEPGIVPHKDWIMDLLEWAKGHMGMPSKYEDEFADDDEPVEGEVVDGESDEADGESDH